MSSADNLGNQFGPRSGPRILGPRSGLTHRQARSGSKLFDILMVFLKEFFQKVNFEKQAADDRKSIKNYPVCNELMTYFTPCFRHGKTDHRHLQGDLSLGRARQRSLGGGLYTPPSRASVTNSLMTYLIPCFRHGKADHRQLQGDLSLRRTRQRSLGGGLYSSLQEHQSQTHL